MIPGRQKSGPGTPPHSRTGKLNSTGRKALAPGGTGAMGVYPAPALPSKGIVRIAEGAAPARRRRNMENTDEYLKRLSLGAKAT